MIRLMIVGNPAPQAGMRAVQTARGARLITAGGTNLKAWRNAVADEAATAANQNGCQTGPQELCVEFRLPMPKSAPKHDREAGRRYRPITPDVDKLLRGLFDGLTAGGLISDDKIIVKVTAVKVDVWESWLGADVRLSEVVPL